LLKEVVAAGHCGSRLDIAEADWVRLRLIAMKLTSIELHTNNVMIVFADDIIVFSPFINRS
jgi:hypothetical protein